MLNQKIRLYEYGESFFTPSLPFQHNAEETVTMLKEHLFDFSFPFYSSSAEDIENFKDVFCRKFYFERLGSETPAMFKFNLQARLKEIMPTYTSIYKSMLDYKIFNDLEIESNINAVNTNVTKNNVTSDNKLETNENNNTSQNDIEKLTNNTTSSLNNKIITSSESDVSGNNHSDTNTQDLDSNFPQINVNPANNYANAVKRGESVVDSTLGNNTKNSGEDNTTQSTTQDMHNQNEKDSTALEIRKNNTTNTLNSETNINVNETNAQNNTQKGANSKAQAIKMYRENIININQELCNDLTNCFSIFSDLYW